MNGGSGPEPHGRFVVEDGLEWYRIDDIEALEPFLVTLVTPDDQWIYVSTSGALTAGRGRAEQALFPYETDDRLHRSGGRTGPVTVIRAGSRGVLWEPFAPHAPLGPVRRSLAKTAIGDRLRFEERHEGLGLTFSATWASGGTHGLVRRCQLILDRNRPAVTVELLDGLVDILPAGVELEAQQTASTLVDAYRRSELDPDSGLALFTLESLITDRAEVAESLRATVVWARGLVGATVALSDRQLRAFRSGRAIEPEHLVTGTKGAFLQSTATTIDGSAPLRWTVVADGQHDHLDVARLRRRLTVSADPVADVDQAIEGAHATLVAVVAEADGLQETADRPAVVHHVANVLFNSMRGGLFLDDHRIELADLDRFVAGRNRSTHRRLPPAVADLGPVVEVDEVRRAVADDVDLLRLVNEYLPLTFSRRHGDPSRPWNRFHIPPVSPEGHPARGYEGNWRDIFQNWEALVHSYPAYIESVVSKFLSASTLDGHNPYRLTDGGLDWETPDEGSWANFGYWGDHQIVYLHRLLDAANRFHPGLLESMLDRRAFASADVPYRIVPYDLLVEDPKATIVFDDEGQRRIDDRVRAIGVDGRLVPAATGGGVHHASLAEKLLIPALAKLSNLVAGGGIWLNTQRPEWNDANNALVGNGVSVVTLFHLRSYLSFVDGVLARSPAIEVEVGQAVVAWMGRLQAGFEAEGQLVDPARITAAGRRRLLDTLGRAFSHYRTTVYAEGPGPSSTVPVTALRRFLAVAGPHLDAAAAAARRPDGLFHSYLLLRLEPGRAELDSLYPMLEGQVAALGPGAADAGATLALVDTLFDSDLYRPDQRSFMLYPNRPPPPFLDKNRVPEPLVGPALSALVDSGDATVARDVEGQVRFGSELRSARHLAAALDDLADPLPAADRAEVFEAYEAVFRHRSFTGRSQIMYRYEGLGSVYWHMVSKLVLVVQDALVDAADRGEDRTLLLELARRYRQLRDGLGYRKTVAAQGAFPTDPHSHTPAHAGAQQPGMTGQVKEGVLLRWGELGVEVADGLVRFRPVVLDPAEFLAEPRPWPPLGGGEVLEPGTLGFTYCGVPIVYRLVDGEAWVRPRWADGRSGGESSPGPGLDREASRALFARTGRITRVDVGVARSALLLADARLR